MNNDKVVDVVRSVVATTGDVRRAVGRELDRRVDERRYAQAAHGCSRQGRRHRVTGMEPSSRGHATLSTTAAFAKQPDQLALDIARRTRTQATTRSEPRRLRVPPAWRPPPSRGGSRHSTRWAPRRALHAHRAAERRRARLLRPESERREALSGGSLEPASAQSLSEARAGAGFAETAASVRWPRARTVARCTNPATSRPVAACAMVVGTSVSRNPRAARGS